MKDIFGKGKNQKDNKVFVTTLGSTLPKKSDGYTPCLEVEFECKEDAIRYFGVDLKITVDESKLKDSKKKGFKYIYFKDCKIKRIDKKEYEKEVANLKNKYK